MKLTTGGYWGHCGQDCAVKPLKQNAQYSASSDGDFFLYFLILI